MRTRLRHLGERLHASLWLVPAIIVVVSILLAMLTLRLDATYPETIARVPILFEGGPDGATALLTAVAGSIMSVTGVIFSITVVALTLASSQFGPRLLRAFIRDRATQLVLGVFISTFAFSLLALRAIDRTAKANPVPELTVTVAVALAFASLGLLIFFVHHVATSIQADTVVARVSRDLHKAIAELYPESLGQALSADEEPKLPARFEEEAVPVRAKRTGYVQAVEEEEVMAAVVEEDATLRLDVRPSDFVVTGGVVGWAWSERGVAEDAAARIGKTLLIGVKPTPEQDVEYLASQLVEVAVRALSPGINDPFTAMRAVDRLSAGLCDLSRRRFPPAARADKDGDLRVLVRRVTWPGIVDTSFDQIRQHAANNVAVTMALLEGLHRVADRLPEGDARLEPLRGQVRQIAEAQEHARSGTEDAAEVMARIERFERRFGARVR